MNYKKISKNFIRDTIEIWGDNTDRLSVCTIKGCRNSPINDDDEGTAYRRPCVFFCESSKLSAINRCPQCTQKPDKVVKSMKPFNEVFPDGYEYRW